MMHTLSAGNRYACGRCGWFGEDNTATSCGNGCGTDTDMIPVVVTVNPDGVSWDITIRDTPDAPAEVTP